MAHAWFFPAAALYATLLLPLSVAGLLGVLPMPPGLAQPLGHAHELLFGYALAVVAGYLLGPQPQPRCLVLLGCWLAARLLFLAYPGSLLAGLAAALFAAGLAWQVLPRFLGAAKKWRNQSVAPMVGLLALLSSLPATGTGLLDGPAQTRSALLLLAGLLFFMGGRIIAPALAGHAQQQGWTLQHRVQPRLEGAGLLGLAAALLLGLQPLNQPLAGLALLLTSLLVLLRWLRWQPWRYRQRADLLILLLGYAWLVIGLALYGLHLLWPLPGGNAALHALSIGALGTLSLAVMARTRLLLCWRNANARPWIHAIALLPSLAALARLLAGLPGLPPALCLALAAGLWSLAFAGLLVLLWQLRDSQRADPRQSSR